MTLRTLTVAAMLMPLLVACSREPEPPRKPVVATVNGDPVYEEHVQVMLDRFSAGAVEDDQAVRRNVVESLVRAKALADHARHSLSAESVERIEARADLYRQELLVAAYLEAEADPQPVSNRMVQEYYNNHREEYALGRRLHLQYLESVEGLDERAKRQLMKAMGEVKADEDWRRAQATLEAQGFKVRFRETRIQASLLAEPLKTIVSRLQPKEASAVFYGDALYRAKLLSSEALGYTPLSEVSAAIRKSLAPVQMKKAVQRLSDDAVGKADIEYSSQ